MKLIIATTMATTLAMAPLLATDNEPANRLDDAAAVLSEIMATPDKGIPQELIENAHCIVIVPDLKTAAFIVGGKYGKGYLSCRNKSGTGWSAPGTVRIEGGSVGFQVGGSSTDLIMLVMSERGADKLLSSQFTLGAEGSVAAGPVGRTATAQTDVQMHADILSWSRTRGLFAGIALQGATLRQDLDDNAALYGRKLENRDIVTNGVRAPESAAKLIALLNESSAKERSKGPDATKEGAAAVIDETKEAGEKTADLTTNIARKTTDKAKEIAGQTADKTKEIAVAVGSKTNAVVSTTGEAITDGWITTKVSAKFVDETLLKGSDINVDTKNYVVTLKGTVGSDAAKARAAVIARSTEGVTNVVNQLSVK